MHRWLAALLGAAAISLSTACGIVGPSCTDESGPVLNADGQVGIGGTASYEVISRQHSNLIMRLTWTDLAAVLGLRATIVSCGEHVGCGMDTVSPPFGPGGSSPIPQPWPAGLREMTVDGTRGKRWHIEIAGDPQRAASFALAVTYDISCES